jgi:uncharacterized protein (TIGR03067 family)
MWVVLVVCLIGSEAPKKPVVDAAELKKLAGHWEVAQQEHGGKKTPAKKLAGLAVEVSGKRMTTREKGDVKEDATILALDPKSKPAAIDLKIASGADMGRVVKGIYKLEGDNLTVCVAEPGKERPTAFAAREGTGHTLFVFKRVKK